MTIAQDLAEIPSEGEPIEEVIKPEEEEEKETPTETPAEIKPEEEKETPAEENKETEEKIPFHKHPRFKSLVEEKNRYKEELDELKERVESKFSELEESRSQTQPIPNWFSDAFGDNPEVWEKYQSHEKEAREEIKREIREELESEQNHKAEESQKWEDWVDDQIETLKDDGLKFEKNELMKVMVDYKPTDEQGNIDFKRGYEILQMTKKKDPEKSEARKQIADDGKPKGEPREKKWKTPEDMKGQGWEINQ